MSQRSASANGRGSPAEPPVNQSVERAARMLGAFSVEEPELSLAELTARLGLTKATAHRYATALRHAGLLRVSDGLYSLGPRVVELAGAALAGLGVVRVAGPFLQRLVAETAQTAVLSVWDGEAPVVVSVNGNTDRLVRIIVATGSRLPPESAQAQVFRAFLSDSAAGDLAAVRERGVASYAHVVEGIATLAAPVFQGAAIVATLALVGTTAAIGTDLDSALARTLREVAEGLSTELGSARAERSEP